MSLILDEHRVYLSDTRRLDAFAAAIAQQVRPGDVVLDLGSGTGILGLLACRAGASRVYALDDGAIAGLNRRIAQDNGFGDRITVLRRLSTRTALPEPVDVVVTDQVGNFGFDAGFLEYMADARRRFLRPGGRTVPGRVWQWLCPIEFDEVEQVVSFWNTRPAGFDFSAVGVMAASTGYPMKLPAAALLSDAQRGGLLDPADGAEPSIDTAHEFTIARPGRLNAIGGWFEAELAPSVTMTNDPRSPACMGRRQVLFPLRTSVDVSPGDRVGLRMRVRPADTLVTWDVTVRPSGAQAPTHRARGSILDGMLLSREDLDQTRLDFTPRITPAGRARQTVLELCDGARSLDTIERLVLERHPDIVANREEAAVFVAEVVGRYAD